MNDNVIVLGSRGVNATGLIRSLGEAGKTVLFISSSACIESRFCSRYVRLPQQSSDWMKALGDICLSLPSKPFVFPTDDATELLIDEHWEDYSSFCHCPHALGKINQLADKHQMALMASLVGLHVPQTILLELNNQSIKTPFLPLILKPTNGFSGNKGDIRICHSISEWEKAIERFRVRNYTHVLCQQLIEGNDIQEVGLMGVALQNGEVVIPGTIWKIRSWPPGRGSTSYAHFVPGVTCEDIGKLTHFVQSTGYTGIFDIEMMIADGVAWFLEINYRNGQYGYTPTKAGYNLPNAWIEGIKTGKLASIASLESIDYMNEREDFQYVKIGLLPFKEWWAQFRGSRAFGMYCPGDQRPFWRQFVKIPDRIKMRLGMKL